MKPSRMTPALQAGFAALLGLAAQAGASDWCPSSSDHTISCSNCTRTLTCNLGGRPIKITGSNVTLEGNGFGVYSSPTYGIWVTGTNAILRNLIIFNPVDEGIYFNQGTGSPDYASVYNVTVEDAYYGMSNASSLTNVSAGGSTFLANYIGVVQSSMGGTRKWLDLYDSRLDRNILAGFYSSDAETQYHWGNKYRYNEYYGAYDVGDYNGGYYHNSEVRYNRYIGLYVYNQGATTLSLTDNYGGSNTAYDCYAYALSLYAANNSWSNQSGCVTTP